MSEAQHHSKSRGKTRDAPVPLGFGAGVGADTARAPVVHAAMPARAWTSAHVASPFALGGAIQRAVVIGRSDDRFEREADHVASTVAGGQSVSAGAISRLPEGGGAPLSRVDEEKKESTPAVQRAAQDESKKETQQVQSCPCEGKKEERTTLQASPIQNKKEDENESKKTLQTSRDAGTGSPRMQSAAARAIGSKGSGAPLQPSIRGVLESRMSAGFGGVRVHTDTAAQETAAALRAKAFTHRSDIWLGRGQSPTNVHLMAHEATHVVQQGAASLQRAPVSSVQRVAEKEAEKPVQRKTEKEESAVQRAPAGEKKEEAPVQRAALKDSKDEAPVQRAAVSGPGTAVVQRSVWGKIKGAAGATWHATGGKVVDAAGRVLAAGADLLWNIVEEVAPDFARVFREIKNQGGVFNYVKNLFFGAARKLFGGIGGDKGFLKKLFERFEIIYGSMKEILAALRQNDCQPLLDGIGRLGQAVSEIAGKAWDAIKDFFQPISDFFANIWNKFKHGFAVVWNWLGDVLGSAWHKFREFCENIWDWTRPIRDTLGAAWRWVKKKLVGVGEGEATGEGGGLVGWVKEKASAAWEWIKEQLQPVLKPLEAVWNKIKAIIPLDAILNLRKTVTDWLHHVSEMLKNMRKPQDVVENQDVLRNEILPAIRKRIAQLREGVLSAGAWVAGQIGGLAGTVTEFLAGLRSHEWLHVIAGAFNWIGEKVNSLASWVKSKVNGLFGFIGDGLTRLSNFIEPLFNALEKVVSVIGDVMGKLSGLVLGKAWRMIPECIREPIKNFIIEKILSHIPIISSIVKMKDVWPKIKSFVLNFLRAVFVKGDLSGAVMMVVRLVLEAAGIDVDRLLAVLGKAADRLVDIIMDPLKFLSNLGAALKKGLNLFLSRIEIHLVNGLLRWLLGPLQKLGVQPLKDLSIGSILNLVLQVLGISESKIRSKLEKLVGPTALKILDHAWKLLKALIDGGPAALWEEIKGQLSDLGEIIIGGITSWITKTLVESGIAWLIKLSNPVGAILEALRVIYKTIETIVQHFNEIVDMVDAVLDSFGNIMDGMLDSAAKWIEEAMGRIVPGVISFLGKLVGIDDPSPKVQEIVKGIQDKVDKALDWLVDKIKTIAMKALGAVKGAIGKVVGLIFPKKTFTVGAEEHGVEAREAGDDYSIVIHSGDMTVEELISLAKAEGVKEAGKLEAAYAEWTKIKVTSEDKTEMEKQSKKKVDEFRKVADLIEIVYKKVPSLAATKIPTQIVYGSADSRLGGTMLVAHPLGPDNLDKGSRPSQDANFPPIWPEIAKKRDGHRLYIKGHLLNQKLGGPGDKLENITPITYSANATHENRVESILKETVTKKSKRLVHYEVHVNYPSSMRVVPKDVNDAEGELAISLSTHWYELVPKASDPSQLEPKGSPQSDTIPNVPPYPQI